MSRFKYLLSALNPTRWSKQTYLVLSALIFLLALTLLAEPIAKMTILKEFYQDVDTATAYSEQLGFNNFVTTIESNEGERAGRGPRGGSRHYENCSRAGTYHNYETNKTTEGAFVCSKNFMSFYWLENLEADTIGLMREDMIAKGWTETSTPYSLDDHIREIQDQVDGQSYGFTFRRSDAISADMFFFVRGSSDYESWCRSFKAGCGPFEKTDRVHQNVMVVEVSARKDYE
jgi:hypothetical protein